MLTVVDKFFGISISCTKLDFFPTFLTSLAVTETFPILRNLSSHGPGRYAKH